MKAANRGLAALLIGNLCLVFGPVFVRMADTGQVASAFWRIALAIAPLFLLARLAAQPAQKLTRPLFWTFLAAGLFFAADLATWHVGLFYTKLANSTLLANCSSFLLPLWSFVIARQLPDRMQGAALALALAGTLMLMGRSYELSPRNLYGDVLSFAAGALYTGYLIVVARARETMAALPVLAWATAMSTLPLLAIAWWLGERILPGDWTPLIALSFVSQIAGQGLMIYALGRVTPILFGLSLLVQPIISAVLGWAWYDERLALPDYAGMILIGIALILVRRSDQGPSVTSQTSGGAP